MYKMAELFDRADSPRDYARRYAAYLADLLTSLDFEVVARIAEELDAAAQRGKAIYFIANGGSAAVASHWVNDLVAGAAVEGQPPFIAYSLADNVESVTAIGNDSAFEDIFEMQLRGRVGAGDVVYAMSVSGNSENLVRALEHARGAGATTIGICGIDGGRMKGRCDIVLHIPTTPDEYGPVEDIFSVLDHMIATYLAMRRGRALHH